MNEPQIGQEYLIKHSGGSKRGKGPTLFFTVKVIDSRENFGRTEYLIEPVSGSGQRFVQRSTLKICSQPTIETTETEKES